MFPGLCRGHEHLGVLAGGGGHGHALYGGVDWRHCATTLEALDTLRSRGFTLCCLEQVMESVELQQFPVDSSARYAVVVGNEVDGVDPAVVDACDVCLEIPQLGTKHSLNVSVSAAVALWHFYSKFLPHIR